MQWQSTKPLCADWNQEGGGGVGFDSTAGPAGGLYKPCNLKLCVGPLSSSFAQQGEPGNETKLLAGGASIQGFVSLQRALRHVQTLMAALWPSAPCCSIIANTVQADSVDASAVHAIVVQAALCFAARQVKHSAEAGMRQRGAQPEKR